MNHLPRARQAFLAVLALYTVFLSFFSPKTIAFAAADALHLCAVQLLPALYPLLIACVLIVDTGTAKQLGFLLRPAARLLGFHSDAAACVLLIGLVGGFAPAAAAVGRLYQRQALTRAEAQRLLPPVICAAPSFVVLAVGGMLGSVRLGLLIYFSQIASNFLCGIAMRLRYGSVPAAPPLRAADYPTASLYAAITDSTFAFLRLAGCVVYFRILAAGTACILRGPYAAAVQLTLEVSAGCAFAASLGSNAAYWCCAVLSLQSLSVFCQIRAILPQEVSLRSLICSRAVHLPLSLAVLNLLLGFLPEHSVYNSLSARVIPLFRCPPDAALLLFAACCLAALQTDCTLQPTRNKL